MSNEKMTEATTKVTPLEAVQKEYVLEDAIESVTSNYIKTDLFVKRTPFESKKDKTKALYSYATHAVVTRTSAERGSCTREFDIDFTPAFPRDSDGNPVKDVDIYKYLDLLYLASDTMPLYVQEISYKDNSGELKKSIRYAVVDSSSYGELSVVLKPRDDSGKYVLGLLTAPLFQRS